MPLAADLPTDITGGVTRLRTSPAGARASICRYSMSRNKRLLAAAVMVSVTVMGGAVSAETGRIKRKPPDIAEAERIASELVMNDSLLQKGDIVVTYRGFFE